MARVSLSWALILGLLAGIGPMCTDLYLPALPEMSEQLAATTTITQLTLTASLIGLGVGQLLFGPLSDKIGRKRPLILSLLGCLLFIHETLPENKRGSSLLLTGRSVVQNRRFMRFCLIQSFMLAGLFAYIGSSSFVLQKEFGFSPMQFSLVFGLNGIGLIIASWIFSRLARRINAMTLLRGGLIAAILCALLTVLCAWIQLPIPALVALFFTIAFCSGIGTVGGAEAMSAVGTQESGTASALMGMSMFVFGGIAAPLSGIGGETLLKMSLAITVCYTLALLVALTRIDNQK
ncbi:putative membrane transport protein [Escherichia coli M605]|uniref:Putative membrane transport protein n=1 Tax=Escherichia coli M605 TaxID=656417 RepID=F4SXK6_ECOLX|nr:MFS transporter [Escherichia coli]EGI17502.1 putative membrane transport protein [Escherichia coli M605]